ELLSERPVVRPGDDRLEGGLVQGEEPPLPTRRFRARPEAFAGIFRNAVEAGLVLHGEGESRRRVQHMLRKGLLDAGELLVDLRESVASFRVQADPGAAEVTERPLQVPGTEPLEAFSL